MRIDFDRALYTRCALWPEAGVGEALRVLWDEPIQSVLGARYRLARLGSYLQPSVTLLSEAAEFRVHAWFSLPDGHARFPTADRGQVSIVQAIDEKGLHGQVVGEVSWLGVALGRDLTRWRGKDWVAEMVRAQGYEDIPDSTWSVSLSAKMTAGVLAHTLARHLESMVGRRILEKQRMMHTAIDE